MNIRNPARVILATFLFTLLAGIGGTWSATAQNTAGLLIGNSDPISYSEQAAATLIAPNLTLGLVWDAIQQALIA
jgi:TRAP-type C4-dicarboxylate transport system permease large subunit